MKGVLKTPFFFVLFIYSPFMKKFVLSTLLTFGLLLSKHAFSNPPELFRLHLFARINHHFDENSSLKQFISTQQSFIEDCWSIFGDLYNQEDYEEDHAYDESPLPDNDSEIIDAHIDHALYNYLNCRIEIDIDEIFEKHKTRKTLDISNPICHAPPNTWEKAKKALVTTYVNQLCLNRAQPLTEFLNDFFTKN